MPSKQAKFSPRNLFEIFITHTSCAYFISLTVNSNACASAIREQSNLVLSWKKKSFKGALPCKRLFDNLFSNLLELRFQGKGGEIPKYIKSRKYLLHSNVKERLSSRRCPQRGAIRLRMWTTWMIVYLVDRSKSSFPFNCSHTFLEIR